MNKEIFENAKLYLVDCYCNVDNYLDHLRLQYKVKPSGSCRMEYNKFDSIQQYLEFLVKDLDNKINAEEEDI